jgi:hypothetical protein
MKLPLTFAVALATLGVAGAALGADAAAPAHASGASTATAASAATGTGFAELSTLPTGRLPPPPKGKRPSMIPGGERVPGFFLVRPKGFGRGDYVALAASAQAAKEMMRGGGGEAASNACFAEARGVGGDDEDGQGEGWSLALQPFVALSASMQGGRPPVTPVHFERLVQEHAGAALEIADAWVDPVTRGVRLIGRSTLPLARVTTLVGGSAVWAGRDDRTVHVVFALPADRDLDRHPSQLFAAVDNEIASSQCSYLRVALVAEKGQGRTATFVNDLQLTTLDPHGKPAAKEPRAKSEPSSLSAILNAAGERPEARFRPVHVHASVSWASRDKEPLLTVASGWDARERTQPF